jgi:hypothetical protein
MVILDMKTMPFYSCAADGESSNSLYKQYVLQAIQSLFIGPILVPPAFFSINMI